MKHAQKLLGLFFILSINCYADESVCANSNPYLQQTCERLKQSSDETQKSRDESYQKELNKNEENMRKQIGEENKPAKPPQSSSAHKMPEWQKALQAPPSAKSQNNAEKSTEKTTTATSEDAPAITELPAPGPTEFASPEAIKLPGGVDMIPVKPSKDSNNAGTIKYY